MNFVANEYPDILDMDNLLIMLKQGNLDPYNLLNGYAAYLRNRNVFRTYNKATCRYHWELFWILWYKSTEIQVKSKASKSNKKKKKRYQKKILLKY
jgi:hypothetical protein